MDRTHGEPLSGPGFGPLDLGARLAPALGNGAAGHGRELDAEAAPLPQGFLVAMDGGVRIHFLDWGGPEITTRETAPGAVLAGRTTDAGHASGHDSTSGANLPDVPGILLIHGLARTAWSWTPVARRLRAGARVAAMDLRGHGLSDAPTAGYEPDQLAEDAIAVAEGAGLLSFADEAGVAVGSGGRPFVVAGHGYGAAVAAWTANALGDRCTGLVLVDGGWTDMLAATEMTPDEWCAAIAEPPEALASMAAWLADREAFDPATWDADQERAARAEVVETAAGRVKLAIHRHALAASVGALWTYEPATVLTAVEARIMALAARDDDEGRHLAALREIAAERAAAGRPVIGAASFPELGHNLVRHVPDAVAAAILAACWRVERDPALDRDAAVPASG